MKNSQSLFSIANAGARAGRNARRTLQGNRNRQGPTARTLPGLSSTVATGRRMQCDPDPPSVPTAVWNTVTLVGTVTAGDTTLTWSDIDITFRSQMGLPDVSTFAPLPLTYRINRVKVWSIAPSLVGAEAPYAPNSLSISPANLSTSQIRDEIVDVCGFNTWAVCGYEWPLGDQSITADRNTSSPILRVYTPTVATKIFYFQILWKFTPPPTSPFRRVFGAGVVQGLNEPYEAPTGDIKCVVLPSSLGSRPNLDRASLASKPVAQL